MIYQLTTSNLLCNSRKFFNHKKEMIFHIKKVVKLTEDHRSKYPNLFKDKMTVSKQEMIDSIRLLKIDDEILAEYETVFGCERSITDPEL